MSVCTHLQSKLKGGSGVEAWVGLEGVVAKVRVVGAVEAVVVEGARTAAVYWVVARVAAGRAKEAVVMAKEVAEMGVVAEELEVAVAVWEGMKEA